MVCVKPARLGGIANALDVLAWCAAQRVPWWIGGMFESGLGRRVTTALSALPGPSLPGDLAPPESYLAADLVAPEARRVDPGTGRLLVAVSDAPGLSPAPSPSALDALAVRPDGGPHRGVTGRDRAPCRGLWGRGPET